MMGRYRIDGHLIAAHVLLGAALILLGAAITAVATFRRASERSGNIAWLAYFFGLMALFPSTWPT